MTAPTSGRHRSTPRFMRIAEHRALAYRQVWRGSIVTTVLNPILFLLAIGVGLGTLVDDDGARTLDGVDYLDFVAPGLMAATAMQIAVNEATYPVLAAVKWIPTAIGQVATPLRPIDIALGHQAWIAVRLATSAIAFVAVMAVAGVIESGWVLTTPPVAVIGGLAFSAPIAAWSIGQQDDYFFPNLLRFVVLPMFLFSGTFFPVDQLPVVLRTLAWVTPLWHCVELVRGLTLGTASLAPSVGHLAVLVAYAALGVIWCGRAYPRRLTP
ncbi:MAG: ABC transporter permease [Acidimicrobiia bacterium]|nr:ABC transporter permease [Acidimicrobiia bacterium]